MKRIISLLSCIALVAATGLFNGCNPTEPEEQPFLNVNPSSLSFTADGGIWALPVHYMLNMLTTTPAFLGSEAESWTVEEFLDLAESLPDDVMLMDNLTQDTLKGLILKPVSFGEFFDQAAGKCSFDSPEFIRLLNFWKTLPKDAAELNKRYPEITGVSRSERYRFYQEGKIALFNGNLDWIDRYYNIQAQWGNDDWFTVGSPCAKGASGTSISAINIMTVTRYCADPELAWEFIRSVYELDSFYVSVDDLPLLKSTFEEKAAEMMTFDTAVYFDGTIIQRKRDAEPPLTLEGPGVLIRFDEDDAEKLLSILDTPACPIMETIPEEVDAIIDEELSAYLAGQGSAEDCAKKIQSRVGIYLAEHK